MSTSDGGIYELEEFTAGICDSEYISEYNTTGEVRSADGGEAKRAEYNREIMNVKYSGAFLYE